MEAKSVSLVVEALNVLSVTSDVSYWARNTILSYGVHEQIVALAQGDEPHVNVAACETLKSIFGNHSEEIESGTLSSSVTMMAELLNHPSVDCVVLTLSIFSEIISHNTSVLSDIEEIGLIPSYLEEM